LCDKDSNGFITKEELAQICEQANDGSVNGILDNVLQCLKPNHEGHISFEEFRSGFEVRDRFWDRFWFVGKGACGEFSVSSERSAGLICGGFVPGCVSG